MFESIYITPPFEGGGVQLSVLAIPPADFDRTKYLELNPDIAEAGFDPAVHFIAVLAIPPADFDRTKYLELNPDIAEAGFDPAVHFIAHGQFENRPIK